MFGFTTLLTIAAAITPLIAADSHRRVPVHRRHHEVAHRARGDISKRASGVRATYYAVGMGACGKVNQPSDFIVALSQATFGYSYPSPWCGKTITISYGGKSTQAVIEDSCPGCPYDGLDMSEGLFSYFADLGEGVLTVDWVESGSGGGNDDPKPTTKAAQPKPTTPTTHWEAPKPTTTWTPPTTTKVQYTPTTHSTEEEPTSTSTRPTTSWTPKTTPTTSAKPTSSPSSTPSPTLSADPSSSSAAPSDSGAGAGSSSPENLQDLNMVLLNYGNLVGAAAAQ